MKYKLALLITLIAATSAVAQGFWRRLDVPPFTSASAQSVASTGESLFVLRGGDEPDHTPELWQYAADTRSWNLVNTSGLPDGALHPGTSLVWDGEETLYALGGGEDNNDFRALYRLSITNLRRGQWERLADTPAPQGDGNALAWDDAGNRLYAILGSNELGGVFASYEPNFNRWSELKFPDEWECTGPGTGLVSLGLFGVFAMQGECRSALLEETRFSTYNAFRLEWSALDSLPIENGAGGSLLWFGNLEPSQSILIYAVTGGLGGTAGFGTFRYNLDNSRWAELATQFCPVGGFVGNRLAYVDDAIHVYQGAPNTLQFRCGGNDFLQLLGVSI